MTSPNNNPNRSWTEMVAASRNERPAPVDVRYGVRAELESLLRKGPVEEEPEWTGVLVNLFHPSFVKLGVAAAFICMLALDVSTVLDTPEAEITYADPLVTLNVGDEEAEWSDWL